MVARGPRGVYDVGAGSGSGLGGRGQRPFTVSVTVSDCFQSLFSDFFSDFSGVFRAGSGAWPRAWLARVLKISDLFVVRDGAGGGRLHSVFSGPAGAQL